MPSVTLPTLPLPRERHQSARQDGPMDHVAATSLGPHRLSPVRARYLAAARTALELLAAPDVAARWDEASVLEGMAVADLAGHLALSGVLIVEQLLDGPDPGAGETTTAGGY